MKQRLVQLIHRCTSCEECNDADIADSLIHNGVILPPCRPGDTVYTVDKIRGAYELIEWRVVEISIDSHSRIVVLEHPHHGIKTCRGCDFEAFGVSAFLHLGTATRALRNRKTGIAPAAEVEK